MNNQQENKFSMYVKVASYLEDHATALSGVTQITDIKSELDTRILNITTADGIATSDTTGYTVQKANAEGALRARILSVGRAASAYFLSIGNLGLMEEVDHRPSELDALRDTELYVRGKKLFDVADPVKTNLSGFNSGPTDVAALNTTADAYYLILELPKRKTEIKSSQAREVVRQMEATDLLLGNLDIYMDTFADTQPLLFDEYKSARSIDDTGSTVQRTRQGDIDPLNVKNVPYSESLIAADSVLQLTNDGTSGPLQFYFGISPTTPVMGGRPMLEVDPGQTITSTATDLGYDATNHFLNIYNPTATASGHWKTVVNG